MKTELRLQPHHVRPDTIVVEVWYDGQFLATINGVDPGPGIRIVSKHGLDIPVLTGRYGDRHRTKEIT